MSTKVQPVPEGYHTITPYLVSDDAVKEVEFLKKAFGAIEVFCSKDEEGRIRHSEFKIGDSVVMLAQAYAEWTSKPAAFYMYVPDVDAAYKQALKAGGVSTAEPEDKPYGDRTAGVRDPSGIDWWIGTRIKDIVHES